MLTIRLIRSHIIQASHQSTLDLHTSREVLCSLLGDATTNDTTSETYDLLFDVRDAEISMNMKEVWVLLQDLRECAPGFDGQLALLDRWGRSFDRVQFFEASSEHVDIHARAFLDFERAVSWLWQSQRLLL